jgi:hypothetical protein
MTNIPAAKVPVVTAEADGPEVTVRALLGVPVSRRPMSVMYAPLGIGTLARRLTVMILSEHGKSVL